MWLFNKKNNASDEELLHNYRLTGQKTYVGELFEKHVRTVYGVCLYYLHDKARAEDAVMQIFEKLMDSLRYTEVRNFKGWLSFVVRNHCINELRQSKSRRFVQDSWLDFEMQLPDADEEQRIASVSDDELLRHLSSVLPLLKDKQRDCIEQFYLQGKSYQEIADDTGWALNEIKSCIQNGKRNLKLKIEERMKQQPDA